jgi:uncharacterized protein
MNWRNFRKSGNVEDRRGGGAARAGGVGIGGIIIALIASAVFGVNPLQVLGLLGGGTGLSGQVSSRGNAQLNDQDLQFVQAVLGDTEDVWAKVFQQAGEQYQPARLVLFSDYTQSGCGAAQSAMGPFYCPADQQIYLDTRFFQELRSTSKSEFARAYVIAHEVAHHVQNVLGISSQVRQLQSRATSKAQQNQLSVRLELQADCFAGVWGHYTAQRGLVNETELRGAIEAAEEIGDDTIQRASRGVVVPDSFTHGSSQQRIDWFLRGLKTGQVAQCDTLKARI